jgi:hypothetical protein
MSSGLGLLLAIFPILSDEEHLPSTVVETSRTDLTHICLIFL